MGQRFVFTGDSITDADRTGASAPLGDGYVSLVARELLNRDPENQVLNTGIGGNTVRDLDSRWVRDVLDISPDVLSIMIGINDVWRKMEGILGQAVPVTEFDQLLRDLVRRAREHGIRTILLLEPFLVEPNLDDPFRIELAGHQAIVRRVAEDMAAHFVPLQDVFDALLETTPPSKLAGDRVHPTAAGHESIAREVLAALDSVKQAV